MTYQKFAISQFGQDILSSVFGPLRKNDHFGVSPVLKMAAPHSSDFSQE